MLLISSMLTYNTSKIESLTHEVARLKKAEADITKKIADLQQKNLSLEKSVSTTKSASLRKSKISQINRNIKSIAEQNKKLSRTKIDLAKKEEALNKERTKMAKRQEQNIRSEISRIPQQITKMILSEEYIESADDRKYNDREYDFFISHASEDKDDFVRPLAVALEKENCKVFYDESSIGLGDSLRKTIDMGLINSRYGLVVFSKNFFKKRWTEYELDGMVSREMNGHKVIIPIWYNITQEDMCNYSPSLAGKKAIVVNGLDDMDDVVEALINLINCEPK